MFHLHQRDQRTLYHFWEEKIKLGCPSPKNNSILLIHMLLYSLSWPVYITNSSITFLRRAVFLSIYHLFLSFYHFCNIHISEASSSKTFVRIFLRFENYYKIKFWTQQVFLRGSCHSLSFLFTTLSITQSWDYNAKGVAYILAQYNLNFRD